MRRLVLPLVVLALAWLPPAHAATATGLHVATTRGQVLALGDASHVGDAGDGGLPSPVVGMASTASGAGCWLATANGVVLRYGDAAFRGSAAAQRLSAPIVGIAASPTGGGCWLITGDGQVASLGDAPGISAPGGLVVGGA